MSSSTMKKTLAVGTSALMAMASVGALTATYTQAAEASEAPEAGAEQAQAQEAQSGFARLSQVVGQFAFSQDTLTSTDVIKSTLGTASQHLCGANPMTDEDVVAVEDWAISVEGAVDNAYTATYEDFLNTDEVQSLVLGCSCAGNPSDGRASVNAEVTGISALTMIQLADPAAFANTVVFTSTDGYEAALPLSYLQSHYCPVVFAVNGSPLVDSVGGTNQLWLGSTSANYFVRNVESIRLEMRQTPPPSPHSDEAREAYQNLPNVGVIYGGEVQ